MYACFVLVEAALPANSYVAFTQFVDAGPINSGNASSSLFIMKRMTDVLQKVFNEAKNKQEAVELTALCSKRGGGSPARANVLPSNAPESLLLSRVPPGMLMRLQTKINTAAMYPVRSGQKRK